MSWHMSVNDGIRERASMYALGLLEPPETGVYEQHLAECEICRREVRAFGLAAEDLPFSLPESRPAPRVRETLLARIGSPSVLIRREEGTWQATPFQGVEVKRLYVDTTTGSVTSLVRIRPGAMYPAHRHAGHEHCYVLEGDLVFSDHILHAGDYEVSAPSTDHAPVTTHNGCLLLLTNNQADQVFE
jgi:anti-sigma factor ChrR (cupin superfamily)